MEAVQISGIVKKYKVSLYRDLGLRDWKVSGRVYRLLICSAKTGRKSQKCRNTKFFEKTERTNVYQAPFFSRLSFFDGTNSSRFRIVYNTNKKSSVIRRAIPPETAALVSPRAKEFLLICPVPPCTCKILVSAKYLLKRWLTDFSDLCRNLTTTCRSTMRKI